MEAYLSYAGFFGSVFSTVATAYFWLVRVRQERPRLRAHFVDKEFFLGAQRDNVRQIGVKFGFVVANYSLLPNAVLGARLWIRVKEGWQEIASLAFDQRTPRPFNLPSLNTALLRLTGTLSFPYQESLEEGNKTVGNYLQFFLAEPRQLRIELRRLNEKADAQILGLPKES